jgi:hypothetical protein
MPKNRIAVYAFLMSLLSHLMGLALLYLLSFSSSELERHLSIEISLIDPTRERPLRPLIHRPPPPSIALTPSIENIRAVLPPQTPRLSRPSFDLPMDISLPVSDQYGFGSDFAFIPTGVGGADLSRGATGLELRRDRPIPIRTPPPLETLHSLELSPGEITDIGTLISPLKELGERISEQTEGRLDLVFVIDTSESMANDIAYVARHLDEMLGKLERAGIDFRVIVVQFRYSMVYAVIGRDVLISKPMRHLGEVREALRGIKCRANERALDALWKAANEVKFRDGAVRRFVFITDELVYGEHKPNDVMELILRKRIRVDVIGLNDPFQKALASMTGGMWIPIWRLKSL